LNGSWQRERRNTSSVTIPKLLQTCWKLGCRSKTFIVDPNVTSGMAGLTGGQKTFQLLEVGIGDEVVLDGESYLIRAVTDTGLVRLERHGVNEPIGKAKFRSMVDDAEVVEVISHE
jgi:hypothetical protein